MDSARRSRSLRPSLSPELPEFPAGELSLPVVSQKVRDLNDALEKTVKRCHYLERVQEKQRVIIDEMRHHIVKMDEHMTKSQTDLAYAQQQLEFVVISLEQEHGVVADHTEQLRLFAGEAGRYGAVADQKNSRPFILVVANWLYMPVVQFVKGVYTLLFPFINTAQSLSLFNSGVLQRYTASQTKARWEQVRRGDLLEMLQNGTFDSVAPHTTSGGTKKSTARE